MGIKKLILNIMLSICNVFVRLRKIDQKKIAFVSLESRQLESDLKLIHDALQGKGYHCVSVLTHFEKNSLWMNFLYFLNTIKQIFVINTSALVIINDNQLCHQQFQAQGRNGAAGMACGRRHQKIRQCDQKRISDCQL